MVILYHLGLLYIQIRGKICVCSYASWLSYFFREISRDEKQYPCPDQFDPLRWMSKTHKPLDPRTFAFGYGRRICPGMHIAQASVWIAIASVLSTFNVKKRKNSAGEDIVPPLEFESGVVW